MSPAWGSQTKRYVLPRRSLTRQVTVLTDETPVALFTPAPLRRKLCSDERSRTTIVYAPARSVRTGAPAAVLSVIVSPGPTVATSFWTAAEPGTAIARAARAAAETRAGRGRMMRLTFFSFRCCAVVGRRVGAREKPARRKSALAASCYRGSDTSTKGSL